MIHKLSSTLMHSIILIAFYLTKQHKKANIGLCIDRAHSIRMKTNFMNNCIHDYLSKEVLLFLFYWIIRSMVGFHSPVGHSFELALF